MKLKNQGKYFLLIMLIISAALWIQGCSDVEFGKSDGSNSGLRSPDSEDPIDNSPDGGNPGIGGDGTGGTPGIGGDGSGTPGIGGDGTCVPSVAAITRPTKIMFLVDTTGSNAYTTTNIGPFPNGSYLSTTATDRSKSFRFNSIKNFVEKYKAKTNFSWSMATFADHTKMAPTTPKSIALINDGNNQNAVFTSTLTQVNTAVQKFYAEGVDEGETPFYAAINMAIGAVRRDRDLANPTTQYLILLITDGMPTDSYDAAHVAQLTGLAPGRVKLSTIFYSSITPSGYHYDYFVAYLRDIARRGAGLFSFAQSTSTSINFAIDDVIPGTPGDPNCLM